MAYRVKKYIFPFCAYPVAEFWKCLSFSIIATPSGLRTKPAGLDESMYIWEQWLLLVEDLR